MVKFILPFFSRLINFFFIFIYSVSETTAVETVVPVVPVFTTPIADLRFGFYLE